MTGVKESLLCQLGGGSGATKGKIKKRGVMENLKYEGRSKELNLFSLERRKVYDVSYHSLPVL